MEDLFAGVDGSSSTPPAGDLTAQEAEILTFERQWWKAQGAKDQAIRDLFAMSSTRYYQILNVLIDHPAAVQREPQLVTRLRRTRESRRRSGSGLLLRQIVDVRS